MIALREEQAKDIRAIRDVNEIAFGGPAEADVVDKLRQTCSELLSIVAVDGNEIVGHILFSPVTVESNDGVIRGMGLAPMAVLPKHQRKGVGTALIERGLALLRERAYPFVIVLGHADYYPRYGFVPASRYGLESQWEGIPDEAFMITVFDRDVLNGVQGVARYRDVFNEAMEGSNEPVQ